MSRRRVFDIIQIGNKDDSQSKAFDFVIVIVIIANIAVLLLDTFEQLDRFDSVFETIEIVTVAVFIVEYILRIWTADYLYPDQSRGKAVLKFVFSFNGIVELFSILPVFFLSGFVVFRMLRVVRIFHLFRLNATYDSFNVITDVLYEKRNQLISSTFIVLILILASSLSIYAVEHQAQPDVYKNAFSGIWWSLSTIFTVGYGDIYPITTLGRCLTVVITILGVGCVAIPTGIISAGFVEHYSRMRNKELPDPSKRDTISLTLADNNPLIGKTVDEAERTYDVSVAAVVRDGAIILPTDQLEFRENDMVIYQTLGERTQLTL